VNLILNENVNLTCHDNKSAYSSSSSTNSISPHSFLQKFLSGFYGSSPPSVNAAEDLCLDRLYADTG
jgi:hypothetical protein